MINELLQNLKSIAMVRCNIFAIYLSQVITELFAVRS